MRKMIHVISIIFIFLVSLCFIYPIILTLTNSLLPRHYLTSDYLIGALRKVIAIPPMVVFDQYYYLLIHNTKYVHMFLNSLFLAFAVATFHVLIGLFTAFSFAKITFPGKKLLLLLYVFVMLLPFQTTLLQNFMLTKWLGIYDTWWALLLPGIFSPFGVILLRQFIAYMPDELSESFYLEAKSTLKLLFYVVFPSVKSGAIALFVLIFADNWNMVEQPLVLISDQSKYPLSVALNGLIQADPTTAFAGCIVYMIPIFSLFYVFNDSILNGLEGIRK